MTTRDDLRLYVARWKAVDAVQAEEQRTATVERRWRQLNAAYGMAQALGLLHHTPTDPSEFAVFERWVKIKERAEQTPPPD